MTGITVALAAGAVGRVTELGLGNVTMLPGVPHEEVPALLAAADICLVPLRDVPLFVERSFDRVVLAREYREILSTSGGRR